MLNEAITPSTSLSVWPSMAIFAALLGLASPGARGAADLWPQFRGASGQGNSSATNVPVAWSATNNVAWRKEIPGQGWSSPVLAQGRIYLTTAVGGTEGAPVSLRALCLSAADGALVWDREV